MRYFVRRWLLLEDKVKDYVIAEELDHLRERVHELDEHCASLTARVSHLEREKRSNV